MSLTSFFTPKSKKTGTPTGSTALLSAGGGGKGLGLTGTLTVHVLSAANLKSCDSNGFSDPFCVVAVQPEARPKKAKTIVKRKTLNPEWVETFVFTVTDATAIRFVVKDRDLMRNDICGSAVVDLLELDFAERSEHNLCIPLIEKGELRISLQFVDGSCLFGLDVTSVCRREQTEVPLIVTKCIAAVECHGLDSVGIYRVPGSKGVIDKLKEDFIKDSSAVEFSAEVLSDINNIASLLKQYFRELPEPLFTNALYEVFVSAVEGNDENVKKEKMTEALKKLPLSMLKTLQCLFRHLQKVLAHGDSNKMTAQNLATCLGPSLLNPTDTHNSTSAATLTPDQMRNFSFKQNDVVVYLLNNPEVLQDIGEDDSEEDKVPTYIGHGVRDRKRSKARILFEMYDKDKSGTLKFDDFRKLSYDMGFYISTNDEDEFQSIDENNKGEINWSQFKQWWESKGTHYQLPVERQQALNQASTYFQYFDTDGSGSLDKDEFTAFHKDLIEHGYDIVADGEECFKELDRDFDGFVSFNEFVHWLVVNGHV